jgi:hypothetical protein
MSTKIKEVDILMSHFNFKHKLAIQDKLLSLLFERQKSLEIPESRDNPDKVYCHLGYGPM